MFSDSYNKMVEDWLHSLGQLEYIESFFDNGYDEIEICKQIGEADLDAIGVSNNVHRKTILNGVNILCEGSKPSKPTYFILENPNSPSKKLNCVNEKVWSNSSSVASSLSNKSNAISSSTSGISVHISNSSHENSMDSDGEAVIMQNDTIFHSCNKNHNLILNPEVFNSKENFTNATDLTIKPHNKDILKLHSRSLNSDKLDSSGSFEIEEVDSNVTSTLSSLKSQPKSNTTSSMEDLGQRLAKLKVDNTTISMRPSSSYTSGYGGHSSTRSDWRNSLHDSSSCNMISAYGHANRSVPPPLPRCPPPSGSCADISDMDSLILQPVCDNKCARMSSVSDWACADCTLPRSSTLNSQQQQQLYHHPGEINPGYAASISRSQSSRSRSLSSSDSTSKGNSLKRMFSFRKSPNNRKHSYKPPAGDLNAREITMSDEDRIRLMIMVKEGTLSMHEALATVKQYELERKKGINKNLNDYIVGDSIKIPVSPEKSYKPSPFRFFRSFSFRSSKRRKLLQDLEYYYKEQEKRQKSIKDKMAAIEPGDESTYSSPQCCSNKSCDQSSRGYCTSKKCGISKRLYNVQSPPTTPCDTHLYCYGSCSKPHKPDLYSDEIVGCPTACSNSPRCSVNRHCAAPPVFKRSCSDCGSNPPNCAYHYGRENESGSYFDRTWAGRHSYHGLPARRHSDVITFVHHVQSSPVPQAYNNDVYGGCQGYPAYDSNASACSGYPSYQYPSQRCHHRGVVTNPIAEEHSPCISSSSSADDINIGPGAMSVQASVHRSDEDNVNNNTPPARQSIKSQKQLHCARSDEPSRPNSPLSECDSHSQHSLSTESELPIEQYKPKKSNQTASPQHLIIKSMEDTNANEVNTSKNKNSLCTLHDNSHQENYAQTSMLVKSNGAPQTVQQLCRKLAIEHLLSTFMENGFETLELFKQLDEDDLTMLGVTDVTDRAKVLTAVTLLPEEEDEYDLPAYAYKSVKETGIYSKVGEPNSKNISNNNILHPNNLIIGSVVDNQRHEPPAVVLPLSALRMNSPVFNGVTSTRDSGCYMEQLNSSAQSQC